MGCVEVGDIGGFWCARPPTYPEYRKLISDFILGGAIFITGWFFGFYSEALSSSHIWILIGSALFSIHGLCLMPMCELFHKQGRYTYLRPVIYNAREKLPTYLKQLFLDKKIDSLDYILLYYWYVVCWDIKPKVVIFLTDIKEKKQIIDAGIIERLQGVGWLSDIGLCITKSCDIKPCDMKNYDKFLHSMKYLDMDGKKIWKDEMLPASVSKIAKFRVWITNAIFVIFLVALIITNIYFNWMYNGIFWS